MRGVNKVILIGNLGGDPEVRHTHNGTAVANLSLAVNETWTDKSGEKQEKVEWVKLVAWGKLAEICKEYLSKGKPIYVEGKIETQSWDDREGNKRYTTQVNVQQLLMLGGTGGGRQGEPPADGPPEVEDGDVPF